MREIEELASKIVIKLNELKKTLSTAESCTGGLIASCITDIPGASKIFLGSMIVYSSDMKKKLLCIPDEFFDNGVVSSKMAYIMAKKIKQISGSDYSISTTGNLGPDILEGKPKGLVYIGVATLNKVIVKEYYFQGDRISNKFDATNEALKLLLEVIVETNA